MVSLRKFEGINKRHRALVDAELEAGTPVIALRPHRDDDPVLGGMMDDVVVERPTLFRAEQMADDSLWLCCYFDNGERVTFNVFARKRGVLEFTVTEEPPEWTDWDFLYERAVAEPVGVSAYDTAVGEALDSLGRVGGEKP